MKIQYSYCDGQTINIEVEDSLGEIIIHLERDEYNTNRRETRRHESYSNDNDKMDTLVDPSADVETDVIRTADYDRLCQAIQALQPQQQELIRQVYFENRKIADIAREQGVTESAVRDRLRKIHIRLKKLLE
ncbi:MAG: sigma-70 family RNA polymerase sigma factor [Eubacteriales bacterium]|nr:sigma-70 family RNA polymerase sigma factor [Eubacteriales bacterium]